MISPHHTQLYLISPPAIELAVFRKALEAALAAGKGFVTSFQLRLKDADDAMIGKAAKELLPVCRAHEVAFIMNDRPDLCAALKLDGIHLGQEDLEKMPISKARQIIGKDAVIGISCHASRHLAMEAGEAGADYVAFGAFHQTTSKPMEKLEKWGTPTPDLLTWWHDYMNLPSVAIGGITPANAAPLAQAGADFLAVINAVWNNPQGPKAAIEQFKQAVGDAANVGAG